MAGLSAGRPIRGVHQEIPRCGTVAKRRDALLVRSSAALSADVKRAATTYMLSDATLVARFIQVTRKSNLTLGDSCYKLHLAATRSRHSRREESDRAASEEDGVRARMMHTLECATTGDEAG
jgi:hypothetical protein